VHQAIKLLVLHWFIYLGLVWVVSVTCDFDVLFIANAVFQLVHVQVPGLVLVLHMDLSSQFSLLQESDSITAITVILKAIFLCFLGVVPWGKKG
jgi:hypothetical protein